jgi:hypothetical protein
MRRDFWDFLHNRRESIQEAGDFFPIGVVASADFTVNFLA